MDSPNFPRVVVLWVLGAVIGACFAAAEAPEAQSKAFPDRFQEKWEKAGPNVRVKRHQDGSRTVFQRSRDDTKHIKRTFGPGGNLKMISVYWIGPRGDPLSCKIFDGSKTLLYKVSYGYNKHTGRLEAERMFDARTPRIDRDEPGKEAPIRVMYYNYDAQGRSTRPEVYTFIEGRRAEEAFGGDGGTYPHDNPFRGGE